MKTAKLLISRADESVYEVRPAVRYRDYAGHRRTASFVVASIKAAAVFPCDRSGEIISWPSVMEATDKTPREMVELLGYVIVENNNLYPYSPMKSMGNFADNIDRGR